MAEEYDKEGKRVRETRRHAAQLGSRGPWPSLNSHVACIHAAVNSEQASSASRSVFVDFAVKAIRRNISRM